MLLLGPAPEDWEEWMLVVNTMARRGGVMDLVDVNAAELPEPTRPILPTYSAVKATAASMKDVDTNEQKDLTILRENRDKTDALKAIEQHIMASDRQLLLYLDGAETVHQNLLALKKRMAPTDRARKMNIARRCRGSAALSTKAMMCCSIAFNASVLSPTLSKNLPVILSEKGEVLLLVCIDILH